MFWLGANISRLLSSANHPSGWLAIKRASLRAFRRKMFNHVLIYLILYRKPLLHGPVLEDVLEACVNRRPVWHLRPERLADFRNCLTDRFPADSLRSVHSETPVLVITPIYAAHESWSCDARLEGMRELIRREAPDASRPATATSKSSRVRTCWDRRGATAWWTEPIPTTSGSS